MTSEEIDILTRMGAPLVTRVRRGKLVVIPDEWVGHTTDPQTIRQRQSKFSRKSRMQRCMPREQGRRDREHPRKYFTWRKLSGHPNHWAPRHSPHKNRFDLDEGWE